MYLQTLRFLLLLCTCVPAGLLAQFDYQLFRPGVQYLYENPDYADNDSDLFTTQYFGARVDAMGCDTLYGSLEVREEVSCVAKVPSPFGYSVCQTEESTMVRFDSTDQLLLYPAAPVGERWLARDDDLTTLYAEVISDAPGTVLGVEDRLKVIAFSTASGERIGDSLVIGQSTDLVSTPRLYRIEDGSPPLTLAGSSAIAGSVQLPAPETYGLAAVGDTFQIDVYNSSTVGAPFAADRPFGGRFSTVEILAVDASNAEAYTYDVRAAIYERGQETTPVAVDTLLTFSRPRLPVAFDRQPGARLDTLYGQDDVSALIALRRDSCGLYHLQVSTPVDYGDDPDCGVDQAGLDADPGPAYTAGSPFSPEDYGSLGGPRRVALVYVSTATVRCGAFRDEAVILSPVRPSPAAIDLPILLYPNPVTAALTVELPQATTAYTLAVYSSLGQRVLLQAGVWERATLPVDGLARGNYLLVVLRNGQPVGRQRFVVR
ncbi:T9SS type A sorting domain-containing protein [Lewinella sp. IMCC34183]|uniref:T9SS type A sorting domain-containing protein n=1 Tax=Lewinella sp. IMCC34183 TaxID=2248762 RepID=UPI000E25AAA4|nr:T9SS type A sorting domain-containing protein [Lewinella sp. IMCC34183]